MGWDQSKLWWGLRGGACLILVGREEFLEEAASELRGKGKDEEGPVRGTDICLSVFSAHAASAVVPLLPSAFCSGCADRHPRARPCLRQRG